MALISASIRRAASVMFRGTEVNLTLVDDLTPESSAEFPHIVDKLPLMIDNTRRREL